MNMKRQKNYCTYLPKDSIVFLWHQDLDGVAVDGLIEARVKAVINGKESMSGQYQHHHVKRLLQAGIAVFDIVNHSRKHKMYQGEIAFVFKNDLFIRDKHRPYYVAQLLAYDQQLIEQKLSCANLHYSEQFARFVENTLTYAGRESEWFQTNPQFPLSLKRIEGKEVFIVARNTYYEQDILALRSTLKRKDTIVIAVDGAADGLLKYKICPDFIIGDMDSIKEKTLHCGAVLLCHEHPNGQSPGKEQLSAMGIEAETIRFVGTSEDVAIAASYWSGADRLYLIGCRMGMTEFLEKGRAGMGATWLCRLQAGDKITDLKGIHKLTSRRSPFPSKRTYGQWKRFLLETLHKLIIERIPLLKKKEVLRHD